jgi:hypothetical protein
MKNDIYDLPDSFYDFAQFGDFQTSINFLKQMAEDEDWTYHNTSSSRISGFPILENYVKNTYHRLAIEKKVAFSNDNKYACFDTGLITRSQKEPIYALFAENINLYINCHWFFSKFFKRGDYDAGKFSKLPDMALYWEDPSKLVYDTRKELVLNIEHIVTDNRERFPEPYKTLSDYQLQTYIKGCIEFSEQKVKRNYKTAVPQYYFPTGTIQLLIPLCINAPDKADLALVVEDYGQMYRASTCLTLDMAINNARLISKPDRDWLNP